MSTVLIVDDLASERELMSKVVTSMGFRVEIAANGDEALVAAKSGKPDLILLDVVMPKQDGFSTCRKLKKDPDTAAIPVVLVTTKGQESDKFWGEKQGCNGYIVKPFKPSELQAEIKKHLR